MLRRLRTMNLAPRSQSAGAGNANLLAWAGRGTPLAAVLLLMAASLLARCYGLRHAVDADHIAAIDTVTRKMMQQGKRPLVSGRGSHWGTPPLWCWPPSPLPRRRPRFRKIWPRFHETGSLDWHGRLRDVPAGDGVSQYGDFARCSGAIFRR